MYQQSLQRVHAYDDSLENQLEFPFAQGCSCQRLGQMVFVTDDTQARHVTRKELQ
jgi:hypothetical protein